MKFSLKACFLAGAMGLAVLPVITSAQAATKVAATAKYVAPRLSFGAPDLGGTWTNATVTPLERDKKYGDRLVMTAQELSDVEKGEKAYEAEGNAPTNPNATVNDLPVNCGRGFSGTNCGYNRGWTDPGDTVMKVGGQPRTSFITSTPNGRIPPYKAGAKPAGRGGTPPPRGGSVNDNPETKTLAEQCLTSFGNSAGPVMLPLLYNNNYKLVQSKDAVVIDVEMVHDARIVRINGQHRTDGIRPWWGDSVGHYEGNTLVVETTNFPQRLAFRGSWQNLKVTEKFTRVAPDRLLYQFTVSDPTLWDADWGGEYEFSASKGLIYEYACHEGNYALEGMLAGARDEDRQKAEAAAKPRAEAPAAAKAR
jgi:hypothetical protein